VRAVGRVGRCVGGGGGGGGYPVGVSTSSSHTNTRHEQHHKRPHEEPPPSLNNDRRWRSDGAYTLPHPGGWPRPSRRGRWGREGGVYVRDRAFLCFRDGVF